MIKVRALDHFQIAAPPGCEARARSFYGQLLGMAEIPKPPNLAIRGGCWFRSESVTLHVGVEVDFRPAKKAHPAFIVNDLESAFEALTNAECLCKWDTEVEGLKRFFTHDPWGNRLEFTDPTS